ncbi:MULTISPECIES: hypothetical protein [unclassified Nocardia]|uniref:hypothetical protein n=1 Tax=unclassified Nocardia TaxID=2637762 RepID=UPI001CE43833|nr:MULTISPECIES: hypothetical protein [unclassified Nocardia]
MSDSLSPRAPRRSHSTRRTRAPLPSTVWAAGTAPLDPTGYGPIPVLSRAVREFTRPDGTVLLAALSAAQRRAVPRVMRSLATDLARHGRTPAWADAAAVDAGRAIADLIIASLLLPLSYPGDPNTLASLTIGAAQRLSPGGVLAVLTRHHHDNQGRLLDPTGPVVTAAQEADLLYLAHIIAVPIVGDTIATAPALATPPAHRHHSTHLDISVFVRAADDLAPLDSDTTA